MLRRGTMRFVCLAFALLSASPALAEAPGVDGPWCLSRHEKLVVVDRKAIEILKRWDSSRRVASLRAIPVSARSTVEATAMLDRLLEVGQQASEDAARYERAGSEIRVSRTLRVERDVYRADEYADLQRLFFATLDDVRAVFVVSRLEARN